MHSRALRTRTRLTSLLAAGVVVAGLGTAVATRASAVTTGVPIPAAHDFATDTWSDPWDFSNANDILVDSQVTGAPMYYASKPRLTGGTLDYYVTDTRGATVSPLWPGVPHSLQMGRDGSLAANTIDASKYTWISMNLYVDRAASGQIAWYTAPQISTTYKGAMPFVENGASTGLVPGWHTYTFKLARFPGYGSAAPQEWAGKIYGLQLYIKPKSTPTHVAVDWVRLFQPDPRLSIASGPVTWDSTPNDSSDNVTGRTFGTLWNGDASALPPGTYAVNDGTGVQSIQLDVPPQPVVLSPDNTGDALLPTGVCFKRAMNSSADIAGVKNAARLSWAGGMLTANNASPTVNDPQVWIRMPSSGVLDGRYFHRVLVTFKGDQPFDLRDTTTGGTHGRVVWYDKRHGKGTPIQTKPWVTYNDRIQTTFDMQSPAGALFEESRGNRYPWGSSPVIAMRWDPNEARGGVRWHLVDFRVCQDSQTRNGSYTIRWTQQSLGNVTITAVDAAGNVTPVTVLAAQAAGAHSFTWTPPTTLRNTRQWIKVTVDNGVSDAATATSSGPLWVR